MRPLTGRQKRFVEEYLIDLNATQAAIRAGYSIKTAGAIAGQNLQKLEIQAAIDVANLERQKKLDITPEKVLAEIAKLAFHDPRKFFDADGRIKPINELDDNTAAALAGIETMHKVVGDDSDGCVVLTKIKIADKGVNLERLGRHLKLFTDRLEVTGAVDLAERIKAARGRVNAE